MAKAKSSTRTFHLLDVAKSLKEQNNKVGLLIQERFPVALLTRAQVAAELGVCPTTVYRWEKVSKVSPVTPKKLRRTGQLRYTEEDVETLRRWMNELEEEAGE